MTVAQLVFDLNAHLPSMRPVTFRSTVALPGAEVGRPASSCAWYHAELVIMQAVQYTFEEDLDKDFLRVVQTTPRRQLSRIATCTAAHLGAVIHCCMHAPYCS